MKSIEEFATEYAHDKYLPVQTSQAVKAGANYVLGEIENFMKGLDPNDTAVVKEQANILIEFVPKQEWSEDDETVLNNLIYALANDKIGNNRDEYVDWLKSLRPQSQWKPSDEQMEYLAKAIITLGEEGDCKTASILNYLRVELKKLRGE